MSGSFRIVLFITCIFFIANYPALIAHAAETSVDNTDQDVQQLGEYIVSDTRLPSVKVNVLTIPAKVTVITSEDIQKIGASTVQEAVQYVAGVVMYDQVGNGFQQTIDLRGFNGQGVTGTSVFVDGVRINEPDFNAVNFDLIPLETIDRIEIYPNASAIFGKSALGGAINIITKRATQKRQISAETLFGSFQRERYNVNASGPIGKFDYYVNFSRETEDGYRDGSDAEISRFFGKVGYRPSEHTDISVSYTYVRDILQQAGPLSLAQISVDRKQNPTPGDFLKNENNFVRINIRQAMPLGFSVSGNAFFRRLNQDSFLNFGTGFASTTTLDIESKGGVLQLTHQGKPFGLKNVMVFGGEFTRNDFNGMATSTFSAPSLSNANEDIVALYFQNSLTIIPEVLITGGIRYDHNQISFDETLNTRPDGAVRFHRITPRVGVSYRVIPSTSVYFNYSEGFRAPTITEIFAFPPFLSNPNLQPAKSRNYEVGIKSRFGAWGELAVALFHTDVTDEIIFACVVCDGTFGDGLNRNAQSVRRRGVEVTFKGKTKQLFSGGINYSFTEAQFRSREVFSPTTIVDPGDSLPLVPKNRLSVIGTVHPKEGIAISLIGLYVSTQFGLFDDANVFPRLPGYFVLNGRASYKKSVPGGILKAFFSINNLLDSEYSTFGTSSAFGRTFVPAPGIALFGGVSYQFNAFPG